MISAEGVRPLELQSLVIGTEEIELSMGKRDAGREYMFVRLPMLAEDIVHRSLNDVQLAILCDVREAIDREIERLQGLSAPNILPGRKAIAS
jgi:hypothetical protein